MRWNSLPCVCNILDITLAAVALKGGNWVQPRMASVSELFLRRVMAHGTEAIYLNSGTDTPALQEAWARLKARGEPVPRLVLCPHEAVAITAAQGHYLACGKPQVAFVHVDVGTANATGALNDARASQIPVVLCAGSSPSVLDSRVPGARTKFVNWLQDVPDQLAIVRNYVKWSTILNHPKAIGPAVDRAYQLALSDPCGPVYLALPREIMMTEIDSTISLGPQHTPPAKFGGLDADTARKIVQGIKAAEFPLLLTGYGGRTPEHRRALTRFAEVMGMGIAEYRGRFSASLNHPLHLGFNPERWVRKSDFILVLDHDVPFVPADMPLRPDCQIVCLGPDPIQSNLITWGFPVDLVAPCDTLRAMADLQRAAQSLWDKGRSEVLPDRVKRVDAEHEKLIEALRNQSKDAPTDRITPYQVGEALTRLCPDASLFEEAVTSGNPFAYGFRPSEQGSYMRNGGSFLGWGLGAALGAKLGDPDRLVISVVGDGAFMFGVPTAALWLSRREKLPILIVILNNSCYNSVRLAARDAYPNGVQVQQGFVGVDLSESPDFEAIARSCGAHGIRIERSEQLVPGLKEALNVVTREGKTAVVNVISEAAEKPL